MRTPSDPTDTGLTLGSPVRQPKPEPGPTKTDTAGVYRGADGKAFTDIPIPTPVWHPVAPVVSELPQYGALCFPAVTWPFETFLGVPIVAMDEEAMQRWCDEEMVKVLPKAGS